MSNKIEAAVDLLEEMVADEIRYLCDEENHVDDINGVVDDEDEGSLVSSADTIIFLLKLTADISAGNWIPANWEDCESKAMEYYEATSNDMYGDTDMAEALQQGLMQAFELEDDEAAA